MLDPTTCADSPSAISSPASACGPTRFVAPAGPMIDLFGPVPALANLSARQAKELRLLTSGTSTLPSTISSLSASLQSSLENKLRARLSMTGSTLYTLTWKPWVTPSGVSRSRLRASVRRTSETETSGQHLLSAWPTATARDWKDGSETPNVPLNALLGRVAWLTGWSTPKVADSRGNPYEPEASDRRSEMRKEVILAGWPTTTTTTDAARSPSQEFTTPNITLNHAAVFAGWPTPVVSDCHKGPHHAADTRIKGTDMTTTAHWCGPARLTVSGVMLTGSDAGMASGGQLNLDHSLWLMGFPPEWANSIPGRADWLRWQGLMQQVSSAPSLTGSSDCVALETPSMQKPLSPGFKP